MSKPFGRDPGSAKKIITDRTTIKQQLNKIAGNGNVAKKIICPPK